MCALCNQDKFINERVNYICTAANVRVLVSLIYLLSYSV